MYMWQSFWAVGSNTQHWASEVDVSKTTAVSDKIIYKCTYTYTCTCEVELCRTHTVRGQGESDPYIHLYIYNYSSKNDSLY